MQKAVVTGAAGFIGKSLVRSLHDRGVNVVAIDRNPVDLPCTFIRGDIERPFLLDEFLTPDTVVFHLAAHASVPASVKDPRFDFNINVAAFLEILESIRKSRASLVFPSSAAVFDSHLPLPHSENAAKRPVSPYGAAKLACEAYCAAYHACYGIDVKVARLFNVFGVGMTRFAIYDFYQGIRRNPYRLEILGDGAQIRDYLYIDDVISGLVLIAEKGVPGSDYNLASGIPATSLEVARTVGVLMGATNLEISCCGRSFPGDVSQWYADIRKVHQLGFRPTLSLEEGLHKTIAWLDEMHMAVPIPTEKPTVNGLVT